MITRIAPTPSGYLHVGNCVNFLLVDWLARADGGEVILRVDDFDADRYRPEFVDDIFRVLDWLGIDWHAGPRSAADFDANYRSRDRQEYYRSHLAPITSSGLAYACECSRADLRAAGSLTCVRGCEHRGLPLAAGATALRVRVPPDTRIEVDGAIVDVNAELGDFVIWRRDDLPAYQLASVILDRDLAVTHVVRGRDLIPSTAAQLFLAPALTAPDFADVEFVHHALLTDSHGGKLSKSQAAGGPMVLDDSTHATVVDAARRIAADHGITPPAALR